jgi:hypothetical protein
MLTQQQREIPIYMPMPPPPGERRALLVEGCALPVWIVGPVGSCPTSAMARAARR